jgi:hypothetical protein
MNETDRDVPVIGEPVPVGAPEPAPLPAEPVPSPRRAEARRTSIVDLLVNPRAFFDALEARPVGLGLPALVVLLSGVIGGIAAYLVSSSLVNAIEIPGAEGFGGIAGAFGFIGALIMTLLVWVVIAAAFFVISMAFKGRGDFNRLLAYVGWGHVPQVIGGIVYLAIMWNYLSNLRIPTLTDPQQIAEWSATLMKDPTMRVATLVSLLFLLWSANIWIFGVRSGRKLSTRDAAITVLVPVAIYILITIVPSLVS